MSRQSISTNGGQITGFVLGFISLTFVTVVTVWNQWGAGAGTTSILVDIEGYNGLWLRCIQHISDIMQCDDYSLSAYHLPLHINFIRGIMCIAIICSVAGFTLSMIGMQCSRLVEKYPRKKYNILRLAAFLFITAGLLTIGGVTWFFVILVKQYFVDVEMYSDITYEIGPVIWMSIPTATMCFVTGTVFLCFPTQIKQRQTYLDEIIQI